MKKESITFNMLRKLIFESIKMDGKAWSSKVRIREVVDNNTYNIFFIAERYNREDNVWVEIEDMGYYEEDKLKDIVHDLQEDPDNELEPFVIAVKGWRPYRWADKI